MRKVFIVGFIVTSCLLMIASNASAGLFDKVLSVVGDVSVEDAGQDPALGPDVSKIPYVELKTALYGLPLGVPMKDVVAWGNEKGVKIEAPDKLFNGIGVIDENRAIRCTGDSIEKMFVAETTPSQEMLNDGIERLNIYFYKDGETFLSYAAYIYVGLEKVQLVADALSKKYGAYVNIQPPAMAGYQQCCSVGDPSAPKDITTWDIYFLISKAFTTNKIMWKRNIVSEGSRNQSFVYYEPNIGKKIIASIDPELTKCKEVAKKQDEETQSKF